MGWYTTLKCARFSYAPLYNGVSIEIGNPRGPETIRRPPFPINHPSKVAAMNKIVFAYTEETPRSRYLIDILKEDFDLILTSSCDEITTFLHESYDSMEALIIDNPSGHKDIKRLLDFVKARNNFASSLPVLILTDHEHAEEDDDYLSDTVVGLIALGDTKATVIQRIKNTIKYRASLGFDDFSKMLEILPSQIYVKDEKGRYVFCSKRWHHIQKKGESIRGLTDMEVRKNKANAILAHQNDLKVMQSGKGIRYTVKEDDDEGIEYLEVIKEPLLEPSGKVGGIIAIINNVTTSELLRQQLRTKSITDQLTGLHNRFYFEEITQRLKAKNELPLTFISADCDGLKTINDRFGHASGDAYICLARDAIKESLPKQSYLFRMGGDEFLAIVPGMGKEEAEELTRRITRSAENYKTDQFALRLSVGCYTILTPDMSIETAVNLSDKAMYQSKRKND